MVHHSPDQKPIRGSSSNPRWHPAGMQHLIPPETGGVASLNHRLMAMNPPGSMEFDYFTTYSPTIEATPFSIHRGE
jgi:hypothetical protein